MRRRLRACVAVLGAAAVVATGVHFADAAAPAPAVPQPTSISLSIAETALTVVVGWSAPVLVPTGSVTFTVDGHRIGSLRLPAIDRVTSTNTVQATLNRVVPPGAARRVVATYTGDRTFAASSATVIRRDPTIKVRVHSSAKRTKYHWYRRPVTVRFHCKAHGAPTACPFGLRLTMPGSNQSITVSADAVNGGVATVTVGHINIDEQKPAVGVQRTGAHLRCLARDDLSGIASCRVKGYVKHGQRRYRAVATDRAGNRSVVTGRL